MDDQTPIEDQQPTQPQAPATAPGNTGDAGERQRADLGEAWRRAGAALGGMGTDVGNSVRQAWDAAGRETTDPEHPGDSLRKLADVVERSVTTARSAATSPEARQRLNEGAMEANNAIERAVRLSLAELGKALQRLEPKDETPPDQR